MICNMTTGFKRVRMYVNIAILAAIATVPFEIFAVREPRPTATDPRVKVITYAPDDVFKYTGYYGYQTSIELAKDESINSLSMGDTTSWQIVPSGNLIFLKPMEQNATTNMTLITNKRTYYFELYAEDTSDIRDPNLAFTVRFLYPDESDSENIRTYTTNTGASLVTTSSIPDLTHPEEYNFHYTISGDTSVSPIKIYDDGTFTYLHFRSVNAEMPAIFAVDDELHEEVVNNHTSTVDPTVIVVERVYKKLSVRSGSKVVCIFNEGYYDDKDKEK